MVATVVMVHGGRARPDDADHFPTFEAPTEPAGILAARAMGSP